MAKVNIKIEGIPYEVESGLTILEAAKTHFKTNDSLTLAQLRDLLNTSRKYSQAIIEYFDKIHITKKDGDIHYLDQGV